uniref:Uncharacterized protein n=1 Tax=viral metagenome TaxID=1070528 RepID=A0A6M3LD08_9ZZZZ
MATGDEILAWKKAIAEMPREEITDCPEDGWPIQKLPDGTYWCEFCGWHWPLRIRKHG